MIESPIKCPLRNYKLNYLNGSQSDTVERNEMKQKQQFDGS